LEQHYLDKYVTLGFVIIKTKYNYETVREMKVEEDNSYMFKRLASHNPPTYGSTLDPKIFEDCVRGMEKLFDTVQCPED